jgi:hypothetical protein
LVFILPLALVIGSPSLGPAAEQKRDAFTPGKPGTKNAIPCCSAPLKTLLMFGQPWMQIGMFSE